MIIPNPPVLSQITLRGKNCPEDCSFSRHVSTSCDSFSFSFLHFARSIYRKKEKTSPHTCSPQKTLPTAFAASPNCSTTISDIGAQGIVRFCFLSQKISSRITDVNPCAQAEKEGKPSLQYDARAVVLIAKTPTLPPRGSLSMRTTILAFTFVTALTVVLYNWM